MYLANFCRGWNFKIGHPHLASHEGFLAGDFTMAGTNFGTDHEVKQELESKEGTSQ